MIVLQVGIDDRMCQEDWNHRVSLVFAASVVQQGVPVSVLLIPVQVETKILSHQPSQLPPSPFRTAAQIPLFSLFLQPLLWNPSPPYPLVPAPSLVSAPDRRDNWPQSTPVSKATVVGGGGRSSLVLHTFNAFSFFSFFSFFLLSSSFLLLLFSSSSSSCQSSTAAAFTR